MSELLQIQSGLVLFSSKQSDLDGIGAREVGVRASQLLSEVNGTVETSSEGTAQHFGDPVEPEPLSIRRVTD